MLRKTIFFCLLLITISFSQQILYPDSTYCFDEVKVAFSETEFNKIDSIVGDTIVYQRKITLLEDKISVMDSIESHLKAKVSVLESQKDVCRESNQLKWYHWLTSGVLAVTAVIISLN